MLVSLTAHATLAILPCFQLVIDHQAESVDEKQKIKSVDKERETKSVHKEHNNLQTKLQPKF